MRPGMHGAPERHPHGWDGHHHPHLRQGDEHWGRGGHHAGPMGRGRHGGHGGFGGAGFGGHGFGGPGGFGGHGGPDGPRGGGRGRRMERGALRGMLLSLLEEGAKHGYELIRCFEERTQGQYAPSPGVLYPTLQLLEDQELVASEAEGGRRVYRLTETGQAEAETLKAQAAAFWERFAMEAPSAGSRHEVAFLQDALDDLSRTIWTRLADSVARGEEGTLRRVREAVEKCQNEIRAIIAAEPQPTTSPAEPGTD